MRTAPRPPFLIPNRVPHDLTQYSSTDLRREVLRACAQPFDSSTSLPLGRRSNMFLVSESCFPPPYGSKHTILPGNVGNVVQMKKVWVTGEYDLVWEFGLVRRVRLAGRRDPTLVFYEFR